MYVSAMSTCLLRGRSTPAIRAMLSLPLFVFRVLADHPHHAFAVDDLALIANLLYRRSDFHKTVSRFVFLKTICSDKQCVRATGHTVITRPRPCHPAGCG